MPNLSKRQQIAGALLDTIDDIAKTAMTVTLLLLSLETNSYVKNSHSNNPDYPFTDEEGARADLIRGTMRFVNYFLSMSTAANVLNHFSQEKYKAALVPATAFASTALIAVAAYNDENYDEYQATILLDVALLFQALPQVMLTAVSLCSAYRISCRSIMGLIDAMMNLTSYIALSAITLSLKPSGVFQMPPDPNSPSSQSAAEILPTFFLVNAGTRVFNNVGTIFSSAQRIYNACRCEPQGELQDDLLNNDRVQVVDEENAAGNVGAGERVERQRNRG